MAEMRWAPIEYNALPNPELRHTLTLNIPMPTALSAQQLYRVLSVDKELKPIDSTIRYRITEQTSDIVDIQINCRSIRQLRLTTNALMDSISLVIATMEAFTPESQQSTQQPSQPITEAEFELNGTGRAG
ncbi:Pcc1-domain-containing protein [Meira miltonrushii]|uniref:Pcc1-domain-containing protein n=1 Tax=Meira miltonrushii TaxID=1280837 RepID=A0A316VB96_9BASI|nr:Pcc1-domain-containing protein [Meira miltonrushii]PWN33493.1 Pcc1-domain-containing protein [Meira miltonrushii]